VAPGAEVRYLPTIGDAVEGGPVRPVDFDGLRITPMAVYAPDLFPGVDAALERDALGGVADAALLASRHPGRRGRGEGDGEKN
jgi:hypothetical protein